MSNRAREFKPDYIDVAGGAADVVGPWLNVEGVDNLSFHVQWASADAIGVFKIEASNAGPVVDASTRQEQPAATPAAHVIYTEATTNPASNNGTHIIPLTDRAERWVRFWYDRTSGTLTALDVAFAGKGI
jgi:hypothetical protein